MKKILKLIIFIAVIAVFIIYGDKISKTYMYPKQYADIVRKVSSKYDVEENLIYSIIKVESNFKKDVSSKAGAKGLMQVMDSTAEEVSKQIDIENFEIDMLYEPQVNIEIGTKYFSNLLKKYNDNVNISLIAYNAGQGNVDKWLANKTITYDQESLNNIPYEETRVYWQKVLREYNSYNIIYKENLDEMK